jgi:hypothetical protein
LVSGISSRHKQSSGQDVSPDRTLKTKRAERVKIVQPFISDRSEFSLVSGVPSRYKQSSGQDVSPDRNGRSEANPDQTRGAERTTVVSPH